MKKTEEKSKKKKWWSYVTNILLLVIIVILIVPSWRKDFQAWFSGLTLSEVDFKSEQRTPVPQDQKNWELITMDGDLLNFADFEGKPIVINFWATWCPSCKSAFPDLGSLRSNFKGEVHFLAVSTESLQLLQESSYAEKYDFIYCSQSYPDFFKIRVFPTLVILDKQMNLVYRLEGAADLDTEDNVSFLNELVQKP